MDTKRVRKVLAGFVLLGGFAASASAQAQPGTDAPQSASRRWTPQTGPVVVRDHRQPPVVVRDHRQPPVVVRDHRQPPVVVRDHRQPQSGPVTRVPARSGPR
jgi:hypothetical protein